MTQPFRNSKGSEYSPLGSYFKEINGTPLLSEEEERDVAYRIEEGDPQARDLMVRANLRLVVHIAGSYTGKGVSLEDLIEEGNLGLMRAVEAFDASRNIRFSTYASFWIKQSFRRALSLTGKSLRIPTYMAALLTKWGRATNQLHNERGHPPTQEEVARFLGLSKKKLNIVKKAIRVYNGERQTEQTDDRWPGDDSFVDFRAKAPDSCMIATDDVKQVLQLLEQIPPREATILRMRFGLNSAEPKTFQEIGEHFNLTRERVRQLERDALAKLSEIIHGK